MRFTLIALLAGAAIVSDVGAQGACNEKCVPIRAGNQIIGWSCQLGGTQRGCVATTSQCTITQCGFTSVRTSGGLLIGVVKDCDVAAGGDRARSAMIAAALDHRVALSLAKQTAQARAAENRAEVTGLP